MRLAMGKFTPLGHHHPRGIVLPFAVAAEASAGGKQTLHVSKTAGCSSLAGFNPNSKWAVACRQPAETRVVPTITMADVFALLPHGLPVSVMKIDAQGTDEALVRSIPLSDLRRVDRLDAETVVDRCKARTLYVGQGHCASLESYMHAHGFSGGCNPNPSYCETDAIFRAGRRRRES